MEPIDVDEEPGQAEGDVETPEALEKIRLAKALPADATAPATPPAAAFPPSPVQPGSSVAATVNSSTHRQSYMRFALECQWQAETRSVCQVGPIPRRSRSD